MPWTILLPAQSDKLPGKISALVNEQLAAGTIRTLDGEEVGDEFAQDAINYQILLGKIDTLLEKLNLDA
jgi:ankyrin repeat/BTB/POZ domain-containing protein 1